MKKSAIILLLAAMLLSACAKTDTPESVGEQEPNDSEATAATEKETEADAPAYDFGGRDCMILCRTDCAYEFVSDDGAADIVSDAVTRRNHAVEQNCNVKLNPVDIPGTWADKDAFMSTITSSVLAGDDTYQIIAGYNAYITTLVTQDCLYNLYDTAIDFTKPWWPRSLMREATCGGKLYFCSGDISTYMIYYMYALYFNKQLIENNGLENPYPLVHEGKWTLDKMLSMATGVYEDINGDGKKDDGDRFGLIVHATYVDPFFFGVGLRTTEKTADDIPVLSASFGGEKTHWLLNTLVDYFNTNDGILVTGNDGYTVNENLFMEGRAIFSVNGFLYAAVKVRDADVDYGILPIPKYDEAQQEYSTVMSFPYSLYGIPVDAKDPAMSAALLECLASESYRTVTPALFETGMKVKYATDNETAQMFDIIRETIVFDFGRVFTNSMSGMTYALFRDAVATKKNNWISIYEKNEKKLTAALEKVVNALTSED